MIEPCPALTLGLVVVDTTGKPLPNIDLDLLEEGSGRSGTRTLNTGEAFIGGLQPGRRHALTLPGFDASLWRVVEERELSKPLTSIPARFVDGGRMEDEKLEVVARAGETLALLAARYGRTNDQVTVAEEPRPRVHEALAEGRRIVCLPRPRQTVPVVPGRAYLIRVGEPRLSIAFSARDLTNARLSRARFRVTASGVDGGLVDVLEGALDERGLGAVTLPGRASQGFLEVGDGKVLIERRFVLGALQPATEPEGLRQRLRLLGFFPKDDSDGALQVALRWFETLAHLPHRSNERTALTLGLLAQS